MKKPYVKPGMYVENFALAQSIATACGANPDSSLGVPNYGSQGSCGWDMGNYVVWTDSGAKCNKLIPENVPFEGVCYNNPNGGTAIFSIS